jgi:hypothetical protein
LDGQRVAQFAHGALARQGHLGLAHQIGQRRAQFVRDIGIEALQLRIGLLQPLPSAH